MISTDTYLKQPGARGRLGGARRVAQPSAAAPSRPPFACDSPQRPADKRATSTPPVPPAAFEPGASPCLIGSPAPACSSECGSAQVLDKENQGAGTLGQGGGPATQAAQGQSEEFGSSPNPYALAECVAAAVVPSAVAAATADAADAAAEQSQATPRCDGTGGAAVEAGGAAEAAGALLLELLRPLQRAFEVASEGGGGGERALGAAMRSLGLPAQVSAPLPTPHSTPLTTHPLPRTPYHTSYHTPLTTPLTIPLTTLLTTPLTTPLARAGRGPGDAAPGRGNGGGAAAAPGPR